MLSDLTVDGHPQVFVVGDLANIPSPDGRAFPQLGSVALQAGQCAAANIVRDVEGKQMEPFDVSRQGDHGDDRPQRCRSPRWASTVTSCTARWRTPHGLASTPYLMGVSRQRRDAFIDWAWDEFGKSRVLDTSDEARLHGEGESDG